VILQYNTKTWTSKKTGKIHAADVNFFADSVGKQELFEVKMTFLQKKLQFTIWCYLEVK
jgi:hypothetical protein